MHRSNSKIFVHSAEKTIVYDSIFSWLDTSFRGPCNIFLWNDGLSTISNERYKILYRREC